MRVTVLVAAYNAARFLPRCLESLLHQTYHDVEVIVIDDASTDETAAIADSAGVKLVRLAANSGQAVARNEGLKHATGDLIAMVDADDWLAPDTLEKAVDEMDGETDCVVLRLVKVYTDGREEEYAIPQGPWSGAEAFHLSLDWTLHGLYIARASLYHRFPFDTATRLFSDDNTTRLHYFASRKVKACQGTYYYRQYAESMTNAHSLLRFDYMEANLSMRRWLDRINAPDEEIRHYEAHRWLNYIGMLWYQHRQHFEADLEPRFRHIYKTFRREDIPMSSRRKFGYRHLHCYCLFRMQTRLYFLLRQIIHCRR